MRILDLFCGAGGAAMGYHQAFPDAEIVGLDNVPQPDYPFEFQQYDLADTDLEFDLDLFAFDLIHASPPCQIHSYLKHGQGQAYEEAHVDLVPWTRGVLQRSDVPWVIENVEHAPLIEPFRLCGTAFDLNTEALGVTWELRRHRLFETSFDVWAPPTCRHQHRPLGVYGDLSLNCRPNNPGRRAPYDSEGLPANDWKAGYKEAEALMGIDWMTPKELVQAIPPAYTEWIGQQL